MKPHTFGACVTFLGAAACCSHAAAAVIPQLTAETTPSIVDQTPQVSIVGPTPAPATTSEPVHIEPDNLTPSGTPSPAPDTAVPHDTEPEIDAEPVLEPHGEEILPESVEPPVMIEEAPQQVVEEVPPVEAPVQPTIVTEPTEAPVIVEAPPVIEPQPQPVQQAPVVTPAPDPAPIVTPQPAPDPVSARLSFCGSGGQALVDSCVGATRFADYDPYGFAPTYAVHWEYGGYSLPTTPGAIIEVTGVGRFKVTGVFATLDYYVHTTDHLPYGAAPVFFQTCLNGNARTMIFIGAVPVD